MTVPDNLRRLHSLRYRISSLQDKTPSFTRASSPRNGSICLTQRMMYSTEPTATTTSPSSAHLDASSKSKTSLDDATNISAKSTVSSPSTTDSKLPYHVSRTVSNSLPVYSEFKGNRSLRLTVVRKIAGDAVVLKNDLVQALGIDPKDAKVTQPAKHIWIKGRYNQEVMDYLLSKQF